MSRLKLHLFGKGPHGQALIYDTRYGTDTVTAASTGWFTFDLKSGCRRIWCDSINGSDSNNGLTAATAKQTYNAAWALWSNSGTGGGSTNPGDQLMLAGGEGQTYTDTVSGNLSLFGGSDATYPCAILGYNSTDPSDATQYGRLVGDDMPALEIGTSLTKTAFDIGYVAVQGVELQGNGSGVQYQTGTQPGLIYQNVRFNRCGVSFSAGSLADGAHVSKSSMWNAAGIFCENYDGAWFQDFIIAHCGWDIGASRDDTVANGGAQVFAHNFYYHASNVNGRFDRVVTADSSLEGLGHRGDTVGCSLIISIDNPFGLGAGGFTSSYTEAPDGIRFKCDDAVIMGSDKCAPAYPGGVAIQWENTLAGSYARNVAVFDFQNFDLGDTVYNRYSTPARSNVAEPVQYMLLDKWSGWRWAPSEHGSTTPYPLASGTSDIANVHESWTDSILDVVPVGFNGTITNVSARVSAPAGYKTRVETYAAMGFSSKAAMMNAMLYRPDLPWAQAIASISLPAMGLTPTYGTVSPPDMTGITVPEAYPEALGDLTIGTLSFARGAASSTVLGGTSADFVLSSADLPSGFTLVGRLLSYSGSGTGAATPTIHILETSTDTLGMHTTAFTLSIAA